mgnify:CR=1 FL=1
MISPRHPVHPACDTRAGQAADYATDQHAGAKGKAARDDVRVFAVFMDDYHLGRYPQEMLPLKKALTEFLGKMMGPQDLATVMNPITPLSALKWTRDKDALTEEGIEFAALPPILTRDQH